MTIELHPPANVTQTIISPYESFPNNEVLPLLIYHKVLAGAHLSANVVIHHLKQNCWRNSWVDGIYDYHHYHSNTHETLAVIQGICTLAFGGHDDNFVEIKQGDVIIIPAGVAHKNLNSSFDFKCVGAYPTDIKYNMNYGKSQEHPMVDSAISKVSTPQSDPIYGAHGLLFHHWKEGQ